MEFNIADVANTLVSQASLFQCSFEDAWNQYMHPLITDNFRYEDVKKYIDEKINMVDVD